MRKKYKFLFIRSALLVAAAPFIVQAYEYGPLPGYTNAPGDNKTSCIASGCHSGTANAGPGNVRILLPDLSTPKTYTPGQKMKLLIQITDATKSAFGFQMTARSGSGNLTQAGTFVPFDSETLVQCADGSIVENPDKDFYYPQVTGGKCPSQFPVEYAEHNIAGYNASLNKGPAFIYAVNWTPPAAASGTVTLYVAANAGPGNPPVQTPTNVYTTTLALTPAAVSSGPNIDPGGIVPVDSSANVIQPGSWISIYSFTAKNLASGTTVWNGDFPQSLGGVSVSINNKPAYLYFVSPTQINLQAPDDTATGSVNVTVTNGSGSTTSTVTLAPQGPAFLLLGDAKHATGIILTPDGSGSQGGGTYDLLGPTSAGAGFRPAKKGESVALYGIGFGPTTPLVPAGAVYNCPATGCAQTINYPTVLLGGGTLKLDFAGIVQEGLYQFNFTVPAGLGTGDRPLQAIVNGVTTPADIFIPLQ